MSTPPTWSPAPDHADADRMGPTANAYQARQDYAAPAPVNPYGAPQYGGGQHDAPPTANPYGVPAAGTVLDHPGLPYGYAAQGTNGLAIASLVTSLASFLVPISAPVGVILGIVALRAIRRDGSEGRGLAAAGIVVGATVTLVMAVLAVFLLSALAPVATTGGLST